MILIADTHAGNEGDQNEFFHMLEKIEGTNETVIFLGDVFDLWIAIKRYETDEHRHFLQWCETQKELRTIGLIEGNHEFFVTKTHRNSFSWISDTTHIQGDLLFAHGDLVNTEDVKYLRFREQIRNKYTEFIARTLPFGPSISHLIKRKSKNTNKHYRSVFPEKAIKAFTDRQAESGIKDLFLGHFHSAYSTIESSGCTAHMIPGWFIKGEVARISEDSHTVDILHWRDI